jgi:hypothetical protein
VEAVMVVPLSVEPWNVPPVKAAPMNPVEAVMVVPLSVLDTTRFAKGCVIFDEFIFEIVFPKMRVLLTIPKARFEAFKLLSKLPKTLEGTVPTIFEALMLLRVLP